MGYEEARREGGRGGAKDLVLVGSSSSERILIVAVDLVILHEELEVVKELARRAERGRIHTTLRQLLMLRANGPPGLEECWSHFQQYPNMVFDSSVHPFENSFSHCWNDATATSPLLGRGVTSELDGVKRSPGPDPLNLPPPVITQTDLKRLVDHKVAIIPPTSPPAPTELGTPSFRKHKPDLPHHSRLVYISKSASEDTSYGDHMPVHHLNKQHSFSAGVLDQCVLPDSGTYVSDSPSFNGHHNSHSTHSSLPQSPTARSPPRKKAVITNESQYPMVNDYKLRLPANPQSAYNMPDRDSRYGYSKQRPSRGATKGWVCHKCYVWNSAGSIHCKTTSCRSPPPVELQEDCIASAPPSFSNGIGINHRQMRHTESSPSIDVSTRHPLSPSHDIVPSAKNYNPYPSPIHRQFGHLPPIDHVPHNVHTLHVPHDSSAPRSEGQPWQCSHCGRSIDGGKVGCPWCGELAPWIEC